MMSPTAVSKTVLLAETLPIRVAAVISMRLAPPMYAPAIRIASPALNFTFTVSTRIITVLKMMSPLVAFAPVSKVRAEFRPL